MKMLTKLATVALLFTCDFAAAAPKQTIKPTYDRVAFQKLMQSKQARMQSIHKAIAVDGFDTILENAEGLSAIAQSATWKMLRTPGYQEQSRHFQEVLAEFTAAAKRHDRGAMLTPYSRLMAACSECHDQVRSRIEE